MLSSLCPGEPDRASKVHRKHPLEIAERELDGLAGAQYSGVVHEATQAPLEILVKTGIPYL